MSNYLRRFKRRAEEKRPRRPIMQRAGSKGWRQLVLAGEPQFYSDQHSTGDQWWQDRFADLVDRKNDDGTIKPRLVAAPKPVRAMPRTKPSMVARPSGMTRQMQRALYRRTCKALGVPWR